MNEDKLRYFIYVRKSSEGKERQAASISDQIDVLQKIAKEADLNVVGTFREEKSAATPGRPVFDEMMTKILKGDANALLVWDTSRLSRNLIDGGTISHYLQHSTIIHIKTPGRTYYPDDAPIMLGLENGMNTEYSIRISKNVKRAIESKIARGESPRQPLPGYIGTGQKGKIIKIINEATSPLMKRAFEYYSTGRFSLSALRETMHKEGLRSVRGNKISKSSWARLLSDPFYIGKMKYKGTIVPGSHPRLISDELFYLVQRILSGKAPIKISKHNPLFKGLIKHSCGYSVSWGKHKGKWYGCCAKGKACEHYAKGNVREDEVEKQILPFVEKIFIQSPRMLTWIASALKEFHQSEIDYRGSVRSELNKQLAILQTRLERLYEDRLDRKVPEEIYNDRFKHYTNEKELILAQLKKLDEGQNEHQDLGIKVFEVASKAKEIFTAKSDKPEVIDKKKALLGLIFFELSLEANRIKPKYSKVGEILANFVPTFKTILEPQKHSIRGLFKQEKTASLNAVLSGGGKGVILELRKQLCLVDDPEYVSDKIDLVLA